MREAWRAFEARVYYPAFAVALTIPDICVSLTLPKKKTSVQRDDYVAWVNKYSHPTELGCDGGSCYKLRCGVIHRANAAGHAHIGRDGIIITPPDAPLQIHGLEIIHGNGKHIAYLNLEDFLRAMNMAAGRWSDDYRDDPTVLKNAMALMTLHPQGLDPYVIGSPVIASIPD